MCQHNLVDRLAGGLAGKKEKEKEKKKAIWWANYDEAPLVVHTQASQTYPRLGILNSRFGLQMSPMRACVGLVAWS